MSEAPELPPVGDAFDFLSGAEWRWGLAIAAWYERDPAPLECAIRDEQLPLTADARAFLADLAGGRITRGKGGRPSERHGWTERAMVAEIFRRRDGGESLEVAIAEVARHRGVTDGAVRGVYERVRKAGVTLDRWRTWGRPDWKPT